MRPVTSTDSATGSDRRDSREVALRRGAFVAARPVRRWNANPREGRAELAEVKSKGHRARATCQLQGIRPRSRGAGPDLA